MIAQRVLAVLAAFWLVLAVAIASLGARSLTLGAALRWLNRGAAEAVFDWAGRGNGSWLWTRVLEPFLMRPAWLGPVFLGVICLGLMLTVPRRAPADRPRHRN